MTLGMYLRGVVLGATCLFCSHAATLSLDNGNFGPPPIFLNSSDFDAADFQFFPIPDPLGVPQLPSVDSVFMLIPQDFAAELGAIPSPGLASLDMDFAPLEMDFGPLDAPEPGSGSLLFAGLLGGMLFYGRRKYQPARSR